MEAFKISLKKDILVVSHERSGTHFLINSLAFNIGVSNTPVNFPITHKNPRDNDSYKSILKDFTIDCKNSENRSIFKSHHDNRFFSSFWNDLVETFDIIYIYRDFLDVATSMFFYFNSNPEVFPSSTSVDELVYKKPCDYKFDYAYSFEDYENFIVRHKSHLNHWMNSSSVFCVSYEDLNENFEDTMDKIFLNLNIETKSSYKKPKISDLSVCPRKGVVGDHANYIENSVIEKLIKDYGEAL